MKHLRRTCAGLILVLALSLPVFAGDMLTPPVAGPQESPGITGDTQFPGATGPQESPGVAGEINIPGITGDTQFPGLLAAIFSLF